MLKKATQMINGKSFEYALLLEFFGKLSIITKVIICENEAFMTAKKSFESYSKQQQGKYLLSASFAVKHSRLSGQINFGQKWLGVSCSQNYFNEIVPIFNLLELYRNESNGTKTWNSLGEDYKHNNIYAYSYCIQK